MAMYSLDFSYLSREPVVQQPYELCTACDFIALVDFTSDSARVPSFESMISPTDTFGR